jgi:predicted small secreted protein
MKFQIQISRFGLACVTVIVAGCTILSLTGCNMMAGLGQDLTSLSNGVAGEKQKNTEARVAYDKK